MTYTVWQHTELEMTSLANQAKELIIFALANEDLLKGDPEEIAGTYVIVLHKQLLFGRLWDKLRGLKGDGLYFSVLKGVSCLIPSDGDEKKSESHLKVVPLSEGKKKDA